MSEPERPSEPKPGDQSGATPPPPGPPPAGPPGPGPDQGHPPQSYPPPGYPPPGYPPPGYPQQGYPPPGYPAARPTNGMAIASLVLGILWIYWIGSILALVFGYLARKQIAERGDGGGGLAKAGIILGWIGIGVLVLVVGGLTVGAVTGNL